MAIAPRAPDLVVLMLATQQGRTIISFDGDFSEYRFRDNLSIPYGVFFIEESKYNIGRDDALMTRKIVSAIEYIAALAENDAEILNNTIFTLTQLTPYGLMKIRPKKHKGQKEVVTNFLYIEEQLYAESYGSFVSVPAIAGELRASESENNSDS